MQHCSNTYVRDSPSCAHIGLRSTVETEKWGLWLANFDLIRSFDNPVPSDIGRAKSKNGLVKGQDQSPEMFSELCMTCGSKDLFRTRLIQAEIKSEIVAVGSVPRATAGNP